jgi:hypothetical protein
MELERTSDSKCKAHSASAQALVLTSTVCLGISEPLLLLEELEKIMD